MPQQRKLRGRETPEKTPTPTVRQAYKSVCAQTFSCRRISKYNGAGLLIYLQGVYVDIFDNVADVHATNCAHVQLSGSLLKIE